MAGVHRVIGSEESPYSVKVRAWFRYKGIEHEWLGRAQAGALYERHARLPLVPLVVTPDDRGLQDSTPLIEALEQDFPTPAIHPDEPLAAFVSALLEEFGDEWGNKWMFHFRWARPVDQIGCAKRLALAMRPELAGDALEAAAATVRERMVSRVWFVGSNAGTAPQIEASYAEALGFLDAHLAQRPYLFGGRPAFADFGLWGQLYNCRRDPTPRQIMESRAPNVVRWVERMLEPAAEGGVRAVERVGGHLEAVAGRAGGCPVPAVELGQRGRHRHRRRRVQRGPQGAGLDAEAAEVPRPLVGGAQGTVCRGAECRRA